MFTEFSAAMSALKETAQLAKIFNDAKTEAEVRAAVGELNVKLMSVQRECISLIELARSYQEETVALKAKIAEYEDFKSEIAGYDLNALDSGTILYSKKIDLNGKEITMHLCPGCLTNKKISILQPSQVSGYAGFDQSECLLCNYRFATDRK
ncbi:hypothetical protein D6T51_07960 [Salmonella enterica subsp. enterica serovar Muenchen]|nr:hypothetical protein [Salmonella enterica subsp. enterica serovar Muenchen]EBY9279772.1 hypothetical protein [Salmonella enterica subsp. enterica serovar Denver]ECD5428200.1 hypothetical protein [Salmonella enterica subsp. enterica serovar Denver]HCM3794308.1 hypothetical protein [Salmonella enterica subsp. enterica serovar Denver]